MRQIRTTADYRWVLPFSIAALICATVLVLGLTEKFLKQPVSLVCDPACADLADLSAQQSMATAAWWMFGVGCLSLLATVGGIFFVRASLLEARNATRIAGQQVELSRHALISTDRALVFFDGCTWLSYRNPDGNVFWGITVHWKNSGSTPALNVRTSTAYRINSEPLPEDWDFAVPKERSPVTMAPGAVLGSHPEFTVRPEQIIGAARCQLHYYIWGTVTYNDIFEGTPTHEGRFCVRLSGYGGDPSRYYDDKDNPVRLYFTNENANQHFS